MQISIVIPNYNGRALLEKNLSHVLQACPNGEIIIVDDASTDTSVEFIKNNYPQLKLIKKATNHGFATSVNLGVKAAAGEIVVLLNTDMVPEPDFLKTLLKHFNDKQVFAVSCREILNSHSGSKTRGRGVGKFIKGFLLHQRGDEGRTNTLWASGGSGAFRKSIWQKLNGMDPLYDPFYWEDVDLGYRAIKSGYSLVFEPKSEVKHHHEEGVIKSKYTPEVVETISYRNQFIFVWKNITDVRLMINHLLWLPWHLATALVWGNRALLRGFVAALSRIGQIIKQRNRQRPLSAISDREALAAFASE